MPKTYGKTPSGREIDDEFIDRAVAEAEKGYDLDKVDLHLLTPKCPQPREATQDWPRCCLRRSPEP